VSGASRLTRDEYESDPEWAMARADLLDAREQHPDDPVAAMLAETWASFRMFLVEVGHSDAAATTRRERVALVEWAEARR